MTSEVQIHADLETRDKYDQAIITRIAVTPFRFNEDKDVTFQELVDRTLYLSFDQNEQIAMGRVSGVETEKWWSEQTEELRIESYYPTANDMKAADVLMECKRFLSRWNYNHFKSFLWARNCGFECFKIQSLNDQLFPGEKHIFNHWNWHEVKTFNHILSGGETTKWRHPDESKWGFQEHNARHDSAMDTFRMIQLWHGNI